MSTIVLWDIDGTLIQNTPTAGTLYLEAIEHVTGVRPTVPVENPHGMTEGQLLTAILEANGLDPARLGEVLFDLDVISREQYERGQVRELCEGVEHALAAVAERGWTNALLTGNGPNRARFKLLAAGLDPADFDWDHSYFGHESPTRHHLTAGARDALGGHRAIIVGDTPNDGLAADSASIPFVAVATGVYAHEQLAATNAIAVLDDLTTGLDGLLAAIESAVGDAPAAAQAEPEVVAPVVELEPDLVAPEAEPEPDFAEAPDRSEEPEPESEPTLTPEPELSGAPIDAESSIAPGPATEPPITPQPSPEPSIVPPSEPAIVPAPEPVIEPAPEPGPLIEPAPEPGPSIEPAPEPGPLIEPPSVPGPPVEPAPEPSPDPSMEIAPEPLVEPEPFFEPRSARSVAPTAGRVDDRGENSDTGELHRV